MFSASVRKWGMLTAVALWAAAAAPASALQAETVEPIVDSAVQPQIIPVGKWAEGLAVTDRGVWVAESGQRTIVELDPARFSVTRRVTVGRLPVGMTIDSDGILSTLVQTDALVWRETLDGKAARSFKVEGCPDGLASGDLYLWVMEEPNCSSENSRLIRINPHDGSQALSPMLGEGDTALTVRAGHVWVTHSVAPALSVVDEKTLEIRNVNLPGLSLGSIANCGDGVCAGGRLGDDNSKGVLVSLDPATMAVQGRQEMDQFISLIASDGKKVVAVGEKGTIWLLSMGALRPLAVLSLRSGPYAPRAILLKGDQLYITDSMRQGENGAILVIDLAKYL